MCESGWCLFSVLPLTSFGFSWLLSSRRKKAPSGYTWVVISVWLLIDEDIPPPHPNPIVSCAYCTGCVVVCCSMYGRTNGLHWWAEHASTLCSHGSRCSFVHQGHSIKLLDGWCWGLFWMISMKTLNIQSVADGILKPWGRLQVGNFGKYWKEVIFFSLS